MTEDIKVNYENDKIEEFYDVMVSFYEPRHGVVTISALSPEHAEEVIKEHLEKCRDLQITKVTNIKYIPDHPFNKQKSDITQHIDNKNIN